MTMHAVVPAQRHKRRESLFVALAIVVIAGCAGAWAMTRGASGVAPTLYDWQVSSFSGLGEDDQAIHSSLIVSAEDIGYMNDDFGDWAPVADLEKVELAPFVKDEFWRLHGEVEWRLIREANFTNGGDTGYLGVNGKAKGQSAYLLLFRHRHLGAARANQIDIWMHPNVAVATPLETKAESLAASGWKQVVVYTGDDERARLKGN
jgi:hypothetical protein